MQNQAGLQEHHTTRRWMSWSLLIVLVMIGAAAIFIVSQKSGQQSAAISYGSFLDQVDAGNVASVTFSGTQIEGELKQPAGGASQTAAELSFTSLMPDFGDPSLIPALRAQHVAIAVAAPSAWSWEWLLAHLPLPMLFIVGIALIMGLVRLMRGGASQSGSSVPMHPMQAVVGGMSKLFKKRDRSEDSSTKDGGTKSG